MNKASRHRGIKRWMIMRNARRTNDHMDSISFPSFFHLDSGHFFFFLYQYLQVIFFFFSLKPNRMLVARTISTKSFLFFRWTRYRDRGAFGTCENNWISTRWPGDGPVVPVAAWSHFEWFKSPFRHVKYVEYVDRWAHSVLFLLICSYLFKGALKRSTSSLFPRSAKCD